MVDENDSDVISMTCDQTYVDEVQKQKQTCSIEKVENARFVCTVWSQAFPGIPRQPFHAFPANKQTAIFSHESVCPFALHEIRQADASQSYLGVHDGHIGCNIHCRDCLLLLVPTVPGLRRNQSISQSRCGYCKLTLAFCRAYTE